ncbi:hypothetical protein ACFQPA_10915 [Halomarina halobia]|uniref:Poly(3-hydroxyalkanoate) polymerase subunit PhaE n=1 Tax=Halomarina halobia TaxID=3033386 RepID=A0ABD6AAF4_9EURY|nr:hypothetical protein [Halomarina sp. PSR21]
MSEYTTPISTAFELQRTTIKQGQRAFERSLEFQRNVNESVLDNLDNQEEAQRNSVELSRSAIHTYLDAVETAFPGSGSNVSEIRRAVDKQFGALLDAHSEAFATTEGEFEKSLDSYDEFSEEYLDALNEQLDLLLDAHQDIERQTVETFDQAMNQFERLQQQMESQAEEAQAQFQEQAEQFQSRFESQLGQFQEQVEQMQQQIEQMQRRADGE